MSGEGQSIHEAVREARRRARLTQAELARKVDARQSAISMFESGQPDVLSDEKIRAIAKELGIEFLPAAEGVPATPGLVLKYCSDPSCPSNVPYRVGSRLCHCPAAVQAPAAERTSCRYCGGLLEAACPGDGCGAPVTAGAFCERCGTPYVPGAARPGREAEAWIARWIRATRLVRSSPGLSDGRDDPRSDDE